MIENEISHVCRTGRKASLVEFGKSFDVREKVVHAGKGNFLVNVGSSVTVLHS